MRKHEFLFLILFSVTALGACKTAQSFDNSKVFVDVIDSPSMFKRIQYKSGNPNFKGQTSLQLEADGNAQIEFVQGNNVSTYEGALAPEENLTFWNAVVAANPCSLSKNRAGQPGENTLSFSIEKQDDTCSGEAWAGQQYEDPALKALVLEINRILAKISGGKVKY